MFDLVAITRCRHQLDDRETSRTWRGQVKFSGGERGAGIGRGSHAQRTPVEVRAQARSDRADHARRFICRRGRDHATTPNRNSGRA